jgi:hypothetical protein
MEQQSSTGLEPIPEAGVVETFHREVRSRIDGGIDRLVSRPRWKTRVVIAILAITLFRAFPFYESIHTDFIEFTWATAQAKLDHPLADTSRIFKPATHESNVTYRITVPIIAHALHLNRTGLLALFALGGVALLYQVLTIVVAIGGSRKLAFLVCLATACIWPGEAAFHELRGGYYDAFAYFLVVSAFAAPSAIASAVLLFAAIWTDERALVGAAFLYFFPLLTSTGGIRRFVTGKSAAAVAAVVAYIGLRAYLTLIYSYTRGATGGVGLHVLKDQVTAVPFAIWTGLGGVWILVAAGIFALWIQKRYWLAAAFSAVLLGAVGSSLIVIDITRSVAYCFPAVFVALAALCHTERIRPIESLAAVAAAISFLFPTYYVEGATIWYWLYPLPLELARLVVKPLAHLMH